MSNFIPVEECVTGGIYRIHSRNLRIGVFNREDKDGFIGIRLKFNSEYLFTEYHHETGGSFGTVRPIELVGQIDQDKIALSERIGRSWCSRCGEFVGQERNEDGKYDRFHLRIPGHPAPIECSDETLKSPYGSYAARQNDKLFNALKSIEKELD